MGGPRPSRRRGFEAFPQAPPQDGASLHFTDEELEAGGGVCVTLQGHAAEATFTTGSLDGAEVISVLPSSSLSSHATQGLAQGGLSVRAVGRCLPHFSGVGWPAGAWQGCFMLPTRPEWAWMWAKLLPQLGDHMGGGRGPLPRSPAWGCSRQPLRAACPEALLCSRHCVVWARRVESLSDNQERWAGTAKVTIAAPQKPVGPNWHMCLPVLFPGGRAALRAHRAPLSPQRSALPSPARCC